MGGVVEDRSAWLAGALQQVAAYSAAALRALRRANPATPPSASIHLNTSPARYQLKLGGVLSIEPARAWAA